MQGSHVSNVMITIISLKPIKISLTDMHKIEILNFTSGVQPDYIWYCNLDIH